MKRTLFLINNEDCPKELWFQKPNEPVMCFTNTRDGYVFVSGDYSGVDLHDGERVHNHKNIPVDRRFITKREALALFPLLKRYL